MRLRNPFHYKLTTCGIPVAKVFEALQSHQPVLHEGASRMLHSSADERGTLQGLARELDEAREDGKS